ncbi:exosome-associated protein 4 [Strigomonas culicis]|uniref:Exosome-associated protein 4 n=1 Tax=Strigomonas culicis TaxID=28005 RepID=S9WH35_9TRYP|nr:exosome-associated protein 4 [Strigomonas culicis]|eukprot:EPY35080.1 exosome-associated protein 4 [Strigomonas culicis]
MEGVAEQVVQLERLAQLLVEVVFEIVSEDGALWDAAATALSAALAVGGFDMYETFSACSAGVSDQGTLLTDLTAEQEASAANVVTVVCSLATGNLLYVHQSGLCDVSTLESLVQQATQGVALRKECVLQQLRESITAKP